MENLTTRERIIIETCPEGGEVFWLRASILEAIEAEGVLSYDPASYTEAVAWYFPAQHGADASLRIWQGRQIDVNLAHHHKLVAPLVAYFRLYPSRDIHSWEYRTPDVWVVLNNQPGAWYMESLLRLFPSGVLMEERYVGGEIEAILWDGEVQESALEDREQCACPVCTE